MGILEGSPVPETYAGPKAWWEVHPGANIVEADMTAQEALVAGGIDWTVSKRRLFPENLAGSGVAESPLREWVSLTRDTDDAPLGIATPSYHLFQNHEMATMVDAVLEKGGANVNTVGALYGGKLTWMLAKFDKTLHVKGDGSPYENFMLALTGHTGRHALTFLSTPVRVWCGNTAAMALESATARINLRHTSGMQNRIEEVQRALDLHVKYLDEFEGTMNALARERMSLAEFKALTEALVPVDTSHPDEKVVALRLARATEKRDQMVTLWQSSPTLEGVGFTAYRALQVVTEYVDHYAVPRDTKRANGGDRLVDGLIDGGGFDLKSRAALLLA